MSVTRLHVDPVAVMPKGAKPPQPVDLHMQADLEFLAVLDHWRERQPDKPDRTEAIRRLVYRGATGQPAPPRHAPDTAAGKR
jgi:hypothetical protein